MTTTRATKTATTVAGLAMFAAACGGGDTNRDSIAPSPPEQIGAATSATATLADSELTYDSDAGLSPTGRARAAIRGEEWCLEDASGVRCVAAEALGSRGGLVWRPDETAIAVTWGAQDQLSVVDFEAGTSVETDLDRHRFLAWSPDGADLLGLDIDIERKIVLLDPTTLDAEVFTDFPEGGVPGAVWVNGIIWGSDPFEGSVFTIVDGGERTSLPGGLGEQDIQDVSADGRFLLTIDEEVLRGQPGPDDRVLRLYDAETATSAGLELPVGTPQGEVTNAQLDADGTHVLLVHDTPDGEALSIGTIDQATSTISTWTQLIEWDDQDPLSPPPFHGKGVLRWDGGTTAWLITESEQLLEVTLSS